MSLFNSFAMLGHWLITSVVVLLGLNGNSGGNVVIRELRLTVCENISQNIECKQQRDRTDKCYLYLWPSMAVIGSLQYTHPCTCSLKSTCQLADQVRSIKIQWLAGDFFYWFLSKNKMKNKNLHVGKLSHWLWPQHNEVSSVCCSEKCFCCPSLKACSLFFLWQRLWEEPIENLCKRFQTPKLNQ